MRMIPFMQQIKSKAFLFAFTVTAIGYLAPASVQKTDYTTIACRPYARQHQGGIESTRNLEERYHRLNSFSIFNLSGSATTPHQIYIQVSRSIDATEHYLCASLEENTMLIHST